MTIEQFIEVVNKTLALKGMPIDVRDLPDANFDDYFDANYTEDEAEAAAEELILCELDSLRELL